MIERLQRIATVLHGFRFGFVLLAVVSGVILGLSFFEQAWLDGDTWLIPGVVGLMWALVMYSLCVLFIQLPPHPETADDWQQRLSLRLRRFGMWLLGALFIGLTLMLLLLTYRLLNVTFF